MSDEIEGGTAETRPSGGAGSPFSRSRAAEEYNGTPRGGGRHGTGRRRAAGWVALRGGRGQLAGRAGAAPRTDGRGGRVRGRPRPRPRRAGDRQRPCAVRGPRP